jgi:hypothetical protein
MPPNLKKTQNNKKTQKDANLFKPTLLAPGFSRLDPLAFFIYPSYSAASSR